jgi:hypothetical protein
MFILTNSETRPENELLFEVRIKACLEPMTESIIIVTKHTDTDAGSSFQVGFSDFGSSLGDKVLNGDIIVDFDLLPFGKQIQQAEDFVAGICTFRVSKLVHDSTQLKFSRRMELPKLSKSKTR